MPRRSDSDYDDYGGYGQPIKRKDGIQSRSQRGAFASNWWAKRWIAVLESYDLGTRLQRGRSYARAGQVVKLDVEPGLVTAAVQGSRPTPYSVKIQVKTLPDDAWERALDAISGQAIFAAQLLDGEMPQEIEVVFQEAEVPLFPEKARDLKTDCSCPDMANPCKHIAAVYYLLGEQFDVDPFLIFRLRGRTREQVIDALRARRAASLSESGAETALTVEAPAPSLTDQVAAYWGGDDILSWELPSIGGVEIDAAVLRRLGAPPEDTKKPLQTIYAAMTAHVLAKLLDGDSGDASTTPETD